MRKGVLEGREWQGRRGEVDCSEIENAIDAIFLPPFLP